MKRLKISLIFCMLFTWAHAESIKSITGNIIFDINNDGASDAKLTSDGLAIGDGLSPSSNLHVQGNVINTGDLVIGGTAGNSTLEIQGTIGYTHQTVSSNTTLSGNSVILVDTSSDNVTVTLPYAGNVMGRLYTIKKTSTSNEVLLNGGGNNIDSDSSYTFTSGNNSSIKVVSNGSQWFVLGQSSIGINSNSVTVWNVNVGTNIGSGDSYEITTDDDYTGAASENTTNSTWNAVEATGTGIALNDSTGAATAVTLDFSCSLGPTAFTQSGDEIFTSYFGGSGFSGNIVFNGLDSNSTYDLIVYAGWKWTNGTNATSVSQSVGTGLTGTIYINSSKVSADQYLTEDTDPDNNTGVVGNWYRIIGLKPDGSNQMVFDLAGGNTPFSGFQLVKY